MTAVTVARPSGYVLADVLAGGRVRDAILVATGTGLVALTSQITIPLGFTPVPLTLATFAVLLTGAALGPLRGVLSLLLFAGFGMAGVPWFAHHGHGWDFASFGYIIGYVLAAAMMGAAAKFGLDRNLLAMFAVSLLGSVVIYAIGVPWLAHYLHVGIPTATRLGARPFIAGDLIKAAAAAALLPATWKLIGEQNRHHG